MMSISKSSRDWYSSGVARHHSAQLQLPHRRLHPLLQSLAANFLKVAVDAVCPCGHREIRKRIVDLVQLEVAALGNLHCPRNHRRRILEHLRHLVRALHKKLVAVELESIRVVDLGARLHAQHYFVRMRVLAAQVVRIVGRHQRNPQIALEPIEIRANLSLFLQPLVLNLEEEISLAEYVFVLLSDCLGFQVPVCGVNLFVTQSLAQFAAQAARKADQPLRVFGQVFFAHPRLPVKPVQARLRRQPDQILVALFVLGQHQQVVVLVIRSFRAMVLGLAHVKLASQDRLDALFLGRIEEVHRPIDISVVRHGDGLLAQRRHAIDELVDVAGPVQQGIFRMQMQMGEFRHG